METVEILEFVSANSQAPRVDRNRGILYGVKFLGERSANAPPDNNYYPRKTRENAISLLEGARINIDHPARRTEGEPRPYGDGAGVARNLKETGSGVIGDAHFNPKHPRWEQICWDAENCPQHLGFSIHARGDGRRENGEKLIEALTKVHSIDLVSRPATTGGLYESRSGYTPSSPMTRQEFTKECFSNEPYIASVVTTPRRHHKYRYRQPGLSVTELVEAVKDRLSADPIPNPGELQAILSRLDDALANLTNGICGPGVVTAVKSAHSLIKKLIDPDEPMPPEDQGQFAEACFGSGGNLCESHRSFSADCFGGVSKRRRGADKPILESSSAGAGDRIKDHKSFAASCFE